MPSVSIVPGDRRILDRYFDPPALAQELQQLGFRHLADLEPEQANPRYLKDRPDGSRVGRGSRGDEAGL